ncbi:MULTISPECIES: energy-coupled thiamine transporter ThiT [Peptoniphilus]|uniref:energy-coupled thiamine transporter ThiT n=1 Tax=Peptoniphilus TaxID=162289 RepID=UPI0001DA9F65|nr:MULTISPECIES: energy-coupled thiamine transporter ThiT [Peptoniphilus]EFI41564.1 putative proton-coupled thiamine transporter YuaJ [Peptoniphilus sp. oral taxon 386 str. F0131]
MRNEKSKMLAEAGVMIALSQILSYVKVFQMPQGGSITIASMVPIIFFSLIWGGKKGILASVTYGILQFALGGEGILNPLSILLDYLLAFGVLGVAGFFPKNITGAITGTSVAVLLRYFFHFLSGWLVFYMYAPEGVAPWIYSLSYNSYMLVELVISVVVITIIYKPLINKLK